MDRWPKEARPDRVLNPYGCRLRDPTQADTGRGVSAPPRPIVFVGIANARNDVERRAL
jgi:hypothetical protein